MSNRAIVIKGAREHNLKNISLEIPRDKLIVITGLSGSGKSSLAFDTIYAEGQRRYVESLSSYARQFLGLMEKPDVDYIDGLSPAISIEQKTTHRNPRSTVGTVTEIYDYFRLLFARIGVPHCPVCGKRIVSQSLDQIVGSLLAYPDGTRLQILSPLVRGRKGEHADKFDLARKKGFVRVRVDGEMRDLAEEIKLDKNRKHAVEIVVDRITVKEGIRSRMAESVETSLEIADGLVNVLIDEKNPGGSDGQAERLFSSKLSCPECGISISELSPRMFSFNSPYGACAECGGLGFILQFDPELIVSDPDKSLYAGVLEVWGKTTSYWYLDQIRNLERNLGFDAHTPWKKLPKRIKDIILYGSEGKKINYTVKRENAEYRFARKFEGVIPNLDRRYRETKSEDMRIWMEGFMSNSVCGKCGGKRLKPESLAVQVAGHTIDRITALSIADAHRLFQEIELSPAESTIAVRIMKEIRERLRFLADVGIDYLTLDRAAGTLSGGESQRIKLATQIGSSLTGVLYVLDEPSIGLHQKDNKKLLATLKRLRDLGNTVIVVEHDEDTIRSADFVVDLGPGAGLHGGYLVAVGSPAAIEADANSLTGRYLAGECFIQVPEARREPLDFIEIKGAHENNLKNINVKFPLGVLCAVTGVSGSGKSTLVIDILYKALSSLVMKSKKYPGKFDKLIGIEKIDKVIDIDQSPIGRTPRSNPATYTGVFTPIRELLARLPDSRMRGYKPGRFSFNVPGGRCESCFGDGMIKIEMHFLPDVYITCDVCKGLRYNHETLDIRYKRKNVYEILEMTVEEALAFFDSIPGVRNKLETLNRVGLGYIKLGQPATTLSGGEAQRVKLSAELSKRATGKTLYLLDEPTTGLHFADIQKLIDVLQSLVDKGNTVIVIEHNLDVIKTADWVVDLGPEGGDDGGTVVAEGSPENITAVKKSYTGQFLKRMFRDRTARSGKCD
ncbi:MAG: excinuclease ABC subunit A [Spirochaetes bacterium RBG_16_49_21]|nr:MAG: excinuclease ABC subunit A [Spirochaetes bacterium RBG_16_49_21]